VGGHINSSNVLLEQEKKERMLAVVQVVKLFTAVIYECL
jgi:hypothetical protein